MVALFRVRRMSAREPAGTVERWSCERARLRHTRPSLRIRPVDCRSGVGDQRVLLPTCTATSATRVTHRTRCCAL